MKSAVRVARILLESGPATATDLARELHLTGTAIRRHLDNLVDSGFVESSDVAPYGPKRPKGRGRPARVYTLTSAGRDAFDQSYDDLAIAALEHLEKIGGPEAIVSFARQRAAEMERKYEPAVAAESMSSRRAQALADALRLDGFAASVEQAGESGIQLCQHHCPVAHVAERFPQICEAEAEAFGRLLGSHVTRLATLSHGDGLCTTHVPLSDPTDSMPSAASAAAELLQSERTPA